MKEVCRARVTSSSKVKVAFLVKICRSGQNRIRVPVTPFRTRPPRCRPDWGVKARPGPRVAKTPGTPRWNDIPWVAGERSTSTSRRAESALTTDEPTPCRPPVATYEPPPNLPPACSLVKTTSTPGEARLGLLVDRDAATVVVHLRGAVRVQGHVDVGAEAAQGLVHGVVDDLPHAVHQAAGVGRPDVHARPFAHRLEPLEDEEVVGVVRVVDGGPSGGAGWHGTPVGAVDCCGHNLPATRRAPETPRLPRGPPSGPRWDGGGLVVTVRSHDATTKVSTISGLATLGFQAASDWWTNTTDNEDGVGEVTRSTGGTDRSGKCPA